MQKRITKGAIQKIEEREASGQITLNKLKDVGQALNMKFVYGFVPPFVGVAVKITFSLPLITKTFKLIAKVITILDQLPLMTK